MGLFKRKKKGEEQPVEIYKPKTCQHKWRDFPWFIEYGRRVNGYSYKYFVTVYEPYVCIYCKERKNVPLENFESSNYTSIETEKRRFENEYKDYIKPRAVVEDMINDMQLVDRQWLKIVDKLKEDPKLVLSNIKSES